MANKVKIESLRGNLRLRWSYQGERYCMSLGLYDSPLARTVAEGKATIIQADLMTSNFDVTMRKYRGEDSDRAEASEITVAGMFAGFFDQRAKNFTEQTRAGYKLITKKIDAFYGVATVASVDQASAEQFRAWVAETTKESTQVQYLGLLCACWRWAIKQGTVTSNPWVEVVKIKVPPQQRPRPFTQVEVAAILAGFKQNRYYSYHTDLITFLFGTGCRTGEAIGLQWKHLSDGCTKVWIGESVSRGVRKSTKTNRDREYKLPSYLVTLLLRRMPEDCKPTDLVFSARRGGVIHLHRLRTAWVAVLKEANVSYRKPYSTRHTFISHALAQGGNPITIAQMTGHDPEILFRHYAADVAGGLQCPDIFA
jgi:integrase